MRSLLQERLRLLRRAAWPLDGEIGDQPLSASLPWTDIVQVRSTRVTSFLTENDSYRYSHYAAPRMAGYIGSRGSPVFDKFVFTVDVFGLGLVVSIQHAGFPILA